MTRTAQAGIAGFVLLLGGGITGYLLLSADIKGTRETMGGNMNSLGGKLESSITALGMKIENSHRAFADKVEPRLNSLEVSVAKLDTRLGGLDRRVEKLEEGMNFLLLKDRYEVAANRVLKAMYENATPEELTVLVKVAPAFSQDPQEFVRMYKDRLPVVRTVGLEFQKLIEMKASLDRVRPPK